MILHAKAQPPESPGARDTVGRKLELQHLGFDIGVEQRSETQRRVVLEVVEATKDTPLRLVECRLRVGSEELVLARTELAARLGGSRRPEAV